MLNNPKISRGYRNNNPLNIDQNPANHWKGKIVPSGDSRFEQFTDMAYGYRAAFVLMRNYIKQGDNTIRKIISRWAPENENRTEDYIAFVANSVNIPADQVISRNDYDILTEMAYAMSLMENGTTYKWMDAITGQTGTTNLKQDYNLPNMEIVQEGWRLL